MISKCLARSFIVNNYLYFLFITFLRHTYTMNIAWHWLQILSASVFELILIRKRIWKTAALIIVNERFKIPYICMFFFYRNKNFWYIWKLKPNKKCNFSFTLLEMMYKGVCYFCWWAFSEVEIQLVRFTQFIVSPISVTAPCLSRWTVYKVLHTLTTQRTLKRRI